MNLKVKAEAETVAEACERRGGCRAGLSGLRMKHLPTGREFPCSGSEWGPNQALRLFYRAVPLSPPEIQRERALAFINQRDGEGSEKARKEIELYDMGCMDLGIWSALSGPAPERIPASECILLERWPVVCCRPRRRKARRSS
jgi:hypothetical protein